MPDVSLHLLAGFRMTRESGEIAPLGKKAQALLAYLALNSGQPPRRETLASLLWGDRFDEQARHSLRQCLLALRKALGDDDGTVLVAEGDTLLLAPGTVVTDVGDFERLAAGSVRGDLETAVALYRGDLLEGLEVKSAGFDEWLASERTRLRILAADALGRLGVLLAEAGDVENAVETAQRLLALDPAREDAHRLLMALYDLSGRRVAALKQYRACAEVLRRELDVEPEPETRRLYEEIRTRSDDAPEPPAASAAPERRGHVPWRKPRLWPLAALALLVAGGLLWFYAIRDPAPVLPPEKPSIVILPFENLDGDPTQDPFIDGVTEDITTALSMISEMFVIDRNSALIYKDRPVKVQDVAEELGVRYVLVGSGRRVGDRVRITAQLIDALEGHHLWADSYDRTLDDIFAVQHEITLQIITALQVQLTEGEQERISLIHGTDKLEAWILGIQALQLARKLTRQDNARARELFQLAAELDPNYPGAWDGLAWTHLVDAKFGWSESPEASLQQAAELAQRVLSLDPSRPRTYGLLGIVQLFGGNHDEAIAFGEQAIALSPNGADVAAYQALTLTYTGDLERSVALLEHAMRLSPYYPDWYQWTLGRAYRLMGRYEDAIAVLRNGSKRTPRSLVSHIELAALYSKMGRASEARTEAAKVLKIDPLFSARAWSEVPPYRDPAIFERELDALRKAGLPE